MSAHTHHHGHSPDEHSHEHSHLSEMDVRVRALETLLTRKGYVDPAALDRALTDHGVTGVVQEAGVPLRPSISTRHMRQEPKASRLSVAQSLGTLTPSSIAARMTEVPAGTVTSNPSMVRLTSASALEAGVP